MKINDGFKWSDVEPQRLIIWVVIVLIPIILGIFAVNLGFEGTSIIIFTGVYLLYPMGTVSFVQDFLKKEHREIGKKVGIAILYLQIALTYSWSLEFLILGLSDRDNFLDLVFQLVGNLAAFILIGGPMGLFSSGALISSWVTF